LLSIVTTIKKGLFLLVAVGSVCPERGPGSACCVMDEKKHKEKQEGVKKREDLFQGRACF
jgi:hypothetical protein